MNIFNVLDKIFFSLALFEMPNLTVSSTTVNTGESITFNCTSVVNVGSTAVSYKIWQNTPDNIIASSSSHVIQPAQTTNAGLYGCKASFDTITRQSASLHQIAGSSLSAVHSNTKMSNFLYFCHTFYLCLEFIDYFKYGIIRKKNVEGTSVYNKD